MKKRVIIFHSPLGENAPADELDVLDQADYMQQGLLALGYDSEIIPFPYNLQELENILTSHNPLFVVNLVETLFADGKLVHLGPFLFDHFSIPYTGCNAHAIYLSSHKTLSKQHMKVHGIPTPAYYSYGDLLAASNCDIRNPFLVKSLWEHASFGLDEDKQLLFSSHGDLLQRMQQEQNPRAFFCEEYIHGREFNLSVIDGPDGPMVLPAAEIRFEYPEGKPRILGYKAKWAEDSFEYIHTVRSFQFTPHDEQLLTSLEAIALKCWNAFDLNGFARVDFRVNEKGYIYVLEINANPCISADSGFVAAALRAGMSPADVVKRLVEGMNRRFPGLNKPQITQIYTD
jgi:D-alanine-D-alanine ligase